MQGVVHTLFRTLGSKGRQPVLPSSPQAGYSSPFSQLFLSAVCSLTLPPHKNRLNPQQRQLSSDNHSRQKYWLFTPERSDPFQRSRDRSTLLMQRKNPPISIRPKAPGLDRLARDQVVTCSLQSRA